MEYSKMALPHVFESFGSENMMEPIETPLITDEMHILSDTFFSQFEFDDKFPLQDWCLPEDVEEETEVLSHTQSILRHDCMWRGSCADEDHEFSYLRFMRKKSQNTVKAVYNKSKLKSLSKIEKRKNTSSCCNKKTIKKILNMKQDDYNCQTSDGELPCSPPDSDSDCDDEIPSFKHEINIDEQLSECFSEFGELFSVSDVTGQSIVYPADSNKCYYDGINIPKEQVKYDIQTTDEEDDEEDDEEEDEEEEEEDSDENEVKQFEEQAKNIIQQNTLNDHCYYSQDVNSKKLDNLGVQTPSDSEEEIDVVTLEKPCKPSLPTHPSPAEQKTFQRTVNNALVKPAPRPRGRPPLNSNNNNNNNNVNVNNNNVNIINNNNNNNNNNIININTINANAINTVNNYNNNKITNDSNVNCRKRVTQEQKQNKKAKTPYQRKPKAEKKAQTKLSVTQPIYQQQSMNSYEKMDSYSEEEPETDKRNQHNNMERQRRVELKDSFEFLRSLVPDLKELDKAPKVKILNTSAKYCEQLEVIFDELDYEKRELERTQLTLRERISKLRQHLSEIYFSRAQQ